MRATARRHVQSSIPTSLMPFELPWWRSRLEDEDQVNCMHCGTRTDDYYDPGLWELSYSEFANVHREQVNDPNWYGPPLNDGSVELRGDIFDRKTCLHICPMCGWWVAEDRAVLPSSKSQRWVVTLTSMSVLQELDLSDINVPLEEVRRYLLRKFDARATMHPRLLELTVTSVFRDSGYRATATAYSNDGGIDVVLESGVGRLVGVQVKRQKGVVEVEQIRAFLGALTLGGYARGVFVSTSSFSKGALRAAEQSTIHHIPITLVDANRFFDMLKYAQLGNALKPDDCGIGRSKPPIFRPHSYYHLNTL